MIKKTILVINLIVKTTFEFIFICTIGIAIGLIVFTTSFIYKSIKNAINYYKANSDN